MCEGEEPMAIQSLNCVQGVPVHPPDLAANRPCPQRIVTVPASFLAVPLPLNLSAGRRYLWLDVGMFWQFDHLAGVF